MGDEPRYGGLITWRILIPPFIILLVFAGLYYIMKWMGDINLTERYFLIIMFIAFLIFIFPMGYCFGGEPITLFSEIKELYKDWRNRKK
jgi:hypothetical protein